MVNARKAHTKIGASLRDTFHNGHIPLDPSYNPTICSAEGVRDSEKFLHEAEAQTVMDMLLDDFQYNYISQYILIL